MFIGRVFAECFNANDLALLLLAGHHLVTMDLTD